MKVQMGPFISVILASHDRREYFFEALGSINNQSLSKEHFEVLVVKDYHDEKVEKLVEDYGFKSIYTDELTFQGKIRVGIEHSHGSILTFLEDDDLYKPERLSVIYEEFMKDPELIYYHNSHIPIDYKGNILERSLYFNVDKTYLIESGPGYDKMLRAVESMNPDFNTSMMAIRKDTFMESMDFFRETTGGVDNFIFFAAARTGGKLMLDSRKIAFYRIHSSQTIRRDDYKTYMKKRGQKEINLYNSYGVIKEMTRGTPAEKLWINQYRIFKAYLGIIQAANGDKQYLPTVIENMGMFWDGLRTHRKFILLLSLWSLLFKLAPRVFKRSYYRYKMWELNRVSDNFE